MGVAMPPTAVEIEGSDAKVGFFQRHFETLPKAKDGWAINSLKCSQFNLILDVKH